MSAALPEAAYAAALAGFEAMTVHRLASLLRHRAPSEAWAVATGDAPADGLVATVLADASVRAAWRRSAAARPPDAVWAVLAARRIDVVLADDDRYPGLLRTDPLPPPVLFARGDLGVLAGRRVGIVGTRNATDAGRTAARRLAADLAVSGVHVVSGLARGIDGAAHSAVLAADAAGRPLAVVGSGPDVVYPAEHRALWESVCERGLLLSEAPPGAAPLAHRFPLRNRLIAALSEVLVVVESRRTGGSLITAAEALERGVPLMAMPGPAVSRSAEGTNELLRDGAAAALDAGDVLAVLAIEHRRAVDAPELRPRPRPDDMEVYDALGTQPRTVDGVALACGLSLVDAAMRLARLEQAGWIGGTDGWFERIGAPLR